MIVAVMTYGCVFLFSFFALHTSVRARNSSLWLAAFLPLDALASGQHHQKGSFFGMTMSALGHWVGPCYTCTTYFHGLTPQRAFFPLSTANRTKWLHSPQRLSHVESLQ